MTDSLTARSISRPLHRALLAADSGFVLGSFEHACDIWLERAGVVAVVTDRIGDGPFNVVVETGGDGLPDSGSEGRVEVADGWLATGDLRVALGGTAVWEPAPDWARLRRRQAAIRAVLPSVREALRAWSSPLQATALGGEPRGPLAMALGEALPAIQSGWAGEYEAAGRGAARLAGLGPGLTPAGDDFLVGLLAWAWVSHPSPLAFGWAVSSAAIPRTTTLAGAWIRAAAAGLLAAPWHHFLTMLASAPPAAEVRPALDPLLALGATSGADALAGFLWLADA